MRQAAALCVTVWLALALCGCSAPAEYTVTRDGREYTVDREAGTISDGTHTYSYTFSGDAGSYEATIEYPNGATYWWRQERGGMGYGGWSEGYDEALYAEGDTLLEVLQEKAPRARSGYGGMGLLLIPVGVFCAVWPRAAWELSHGWRFRNAEPSDAALAVNRICGVLVVLVGIIVFFV